MAATLQIPIGQMRQETTKAIERFKQGKPGDIISLAEMAGVLGVQLTGEGRLPGNSHAWVRTAIKRIKRDYRIWWKWDRNGRCWRCLQEEEKVREQSHRVRLHRGRFREEAKDSVSIKTDTLDVTLRHEHLANQTMILMAHQVTSSPMRRALASSGKLESLTQPTLPKLIELMSENGPDGGPNTT
jgi:hypothetical protein